MLTPDKISDWQDLTLRDLVYAYRKAKADCYFEHAILSAENFADYEASLTTNLQTLLEKLRAAEVDSILQSQILAPALVAKKLTIREKENSSAEQAHDFFSNPDRFFRRLRKSKNFRAEFRLIGHFSVESHIISALWVNYIGHKFDAALSENAYGSRLRRFRGEEVESGIKRPGEYHVEALGSFEPYFKPYTAWRSKGFSSIEGELKANRPVAVVTLDLANYYHSIDPSFIGKASFQDAVGVKLNQWEAKFTDSISRFLGVWSKMAMERLFEFGTPHAAVTIGGIPIGLSATRVIANVLLCKLDHDIKHQLSPVYYGRYVDDIFLVLHDPGNISSAEELFDWISKRVRLFQAGSDGITRIAFSEDYCGNSRIHLQERKKKVFFLDGQAGLDLLSNIESEIREVSSERRLLPDPTEIENSASAKLLATSESAVDEIYSLNGTNELSIRRLGWSILLKRVETLAKDLQASDWKTERDKFYQFAYSHILRPDKILDHADYLPRIMSFAISLGDWDHALKIWTISLSSIQSLESAIESSSDNRIQINGSEIFPHVELTHLIWHSLLSHLRKVCVDSVLRALPLDRFHRPFEMPHPAKQLLEELGFHANSDEIYEKALRLIQSDLARTPYKEFVRKSASYMRTQIEANESILTAEYTYVERLSRFLENTRSTKFPSTFVRRIGYAKVLDVLRAPIDESLVPYVFPTRPYTAQEIALYDPELLTNVDQINSDLWAKYTQAVRGTWTLERDQALNQKDSFATGIDGDGGNGVDDTHNILKIGNTDPNKKIVLGITNLLTEEMSWRHSANNSPDVSKKRYGQLVRLLNLALTANPRPTHLLLPEVSVPECWLPTFAGALNRSGISLVAGLEYTHHPDPDLIHSDAVLILSDDRFGYPTWVQLRQAKLEPAPDEGFLLQKDFGKRWPDKLTLGGPIKPVYNHQGFYFGVLVCSELQNINHRSRFQGQIDCLMVLSWNKDLDTFSALVESAALDVHAYIALVNNRIHGDSRVRVPAKESFKRDICRLRGGDDDFLAVVTLDIDKLRAFHARHERWTSPGDPYKPVPEGFQKPPKGRKAVPR